MNAGLLVAYIALWLAFIGLISYICPRLCSAAQFRIRKRHDP